MAVVAPEEWIARARYDIETARAMLNARRYLYVLFCCQQAVEKALKAVIAKRTADTPPRLHNLIHLAERAAVETDESKAHLFRVLTSCYIQSRYPEEIDAVDGGVTRAGALALLRQTEEMLEWILSSIE